MMIKMEELQDMKPGLGKLAMQSGLSVKTSFNISRVIRQIASGIDLLDEQHRRLVLKYAGVTPEPDEKGMVSVLPEHKNAYAKDIAELMVLEVEFDIEPISISDLEGATMTPADFLLLGPIIKE